MLRVTVRVHGNVAAIEEAHRQCCGSTMPQIWFSAGGKVIHTVSDPTGVKSCGETQTLSVAYNRVFAPKIGDGWMGRSGRYPFEQNPSVPPLPGMACLGMPCSTNCSGSVVAGNES
jgi:hypothetical protein